MAENQIKALFLGHHRYAYFTCHIRMYDAVIVVHRIINPCSLGEIQVKYYLCVGGVVNICPEFGIDIPPLRGPGCAKNYSVLVNWKLPTEKREMKYSISGGFKLNYLTIKTTHSLIWSLNIYEVIFDNTVNQVRKI